MEVDKELVDRLLKDYQKPEDIIGENGLLKQLTKALVEQAQPAPRKDRANPSSPKPLFDKRQRIVVA